MYNNNQNIKSGHQKFSKTYRENPNKDTSWQKVSKWYSEKVGDKGQYFHEKIIIPKSLELLKLKDSDSVLDLACGEGIFSRSISQKVKYVGVDLSSSLIREAENKKKVENYKFIVGDVSTNLALPGVNRFSVGIIMLAIQNIENYDGVFKNFSNHLNKDGRLLIIINHPYFRAPRLTGWGIDEGNKKQYRKSYGYMTPQKIPINMTPGQGKETNTWSFHVPLQDYIRALSKNGFVVELIEEWVSDKHSVGKASKMENLARNEFPMFMGILARRA